MDISDATLIALGAALTTGSIIVLCIVRWREQRPLVVDTSIVETIPEWAVRK